jgi:hypothetical protein
MHFKANGWIRVGFTKVVTNIAKKTFGNGSLFITLKGMQLLINITYILTKMKLCPKINRTSNI